MPKNLKFLSVTLVVALSLLLSPVSGCNFITNTGTEPQQGETPDINLEVIDEVWKIIFEDYVVGMLEALDDPYSSYMDTAEYQSSMEGIEGKFEGIGAYVGMKDDRVTIIAPIPDSPAAKAGIRAGDVILAIDGESAEGISVTEAVLRIRGPKGTPVRLLVLHEGETEPVELEIIRDEIKLASVIFEMKDDIAYIAIVHFTERTSDEFEPVMDRLAISGAKGIVLDLRSNPGGLLESVVDVASRFIDDGVVLYVVDNKGNRTTHSVNPDIDKTTDLPMVVLTDNYTASASEVLSGALQDHHRATIAGTVTYGKGSVNLLYPLKDNSGLYMTYARWLTPDGHLIEGKGVVPDYEFDLKGEEAVQWALDYLKENR
jgi:carboxyl-terminal processing protease